MNRTHVLILGAGPTGLEAGLAAVEAGLDFTILEIADGPAGNVRSWGHVRAFTPWSMNVSVLAREQLAAADIRVPDGDRCPTGHDLIRDLLRPIAELPELAPLIRYGMRALEIGRDGLLKNDEIGTPQRGEMPFRVLVEQAGEESLIFADIVLDCTGNYHNPNPLGRSGIHAPGERSVADSIVREVPDVLGNESDWSGKRILVVGAGYSAQTAARDQAELRSRHPDTEVTWAMLSQAPTLGEVENDPLPERAALVTSARGLMSAAKSGTSDHRGIDVRLGRSVEVLLRTSAGIEVTLRNSLTDETESVVVDRIIALTGYVGDHTIYRQLQVHECWATSGPMKLSAALLASSSVDCLAQTGQEVDVLRNPEPDFFILGAKSYGRNSTFLMRVGWEQVDEVFSLLNPSPAIHGEGR
jgi:hypothetical protein